MERNFRLLITNSGTEQKIVDISAGVTKSLVFIDQLLGAYPINDQE